MALHQLKLTSLLIISLFVVTIATGLAWLMNTAESVEDIMGATATYTAILVVFVGAVTTILTSS